MGLHLMALLYIVGGFFHFYKPSFYRPLMPSYIPWHNFIIYFSGLIEILLGVALEVPRTQSLAAWGLIAFLICVLPVHIYMLQEKDGKFKNIYRWFLYGRPFLQVALMCWAYSYT